MKTYLVGGAVRDELLGREVKDRDYVVVGSSHEEMLQLGFECVGQDFPVYLHKITNEEYALARRERKVADGYTGFSFVTDGVSLAEDLGRRDLTINSMARDKYTGGNRLYDPYNGLKDLENKVLRHTSEAFAEDPLRVVRLARFYARYSDLGFTVAPETMELCTMMVARGDLNQLPPERFWAEFQKAFEDKSVHKFFELLFAVGAFGYHRVKFFSDVFGYVADSDDLRWVMQSAEAARQLQKDDRLEVFMALHYTDLTKNFVSTRSRKVRDVLNAFMDLPAPSAKSLTGGFYLAGAWGNGKVMDTVLSALETYEVASDTTMLRKIPSFKVRRALAEAQKVSSTDFPEVQGPALGQAIRAAREAAVERVLNPE